MNSKSGFVLLYRKIFNSTDFKNQLDTSVFIYLMSMASHEPIEVIYRCKKIFLNRGEVCIAERDLAKKFDITKSKVKSIIKRLINNHNLTQRTTKRLSIYAIVKYEKYQAQRGENDQKTTINSTTEQQSNNLTNTYTSIGNKYNKVINMKKAIINKSSIPTLQSLNKVIKKDDDELTRILKEKGRAAYEEYIKKNTC